MKKVVKMFACVGVLALISSCASVIPMGAFYTNATLPAQVASSEGIPKDAKVGTSEATSYCGAVLLGDCSIDKAVKEGEIEKVYYVDWKVTNPWYVPIKTVYTTTVYGK